MQSKDQIQIGFSEAHGRKPGDVDRPPFYPSEARAAGPGDWRPGQQQGAAAQGRHLFEEENEKAQEFLEAAAQRQEQLQQKCQQLQQKRQRLKEELEKLGVQVPAQGQSKQEEGAGPGEAVSPGIRFREQRQLMKGAL
ncbi:hypothetical protein E2I00_002211, partial [Balaenoptera physalus]